MHVISTGTLVLVSSLYYKHDRSRKGALIALILGSLAMTAIMIPTNLFFTVRFWGQPLEVVKASLVPIIIPFNLIKALGNSLIVFLIYKPLRNYIK
jgi:riboflavin transporter FmnP